ncbi:antibiotic biosynthesis monooxygenase family protein [Aquimarina sp. 2201CG14-23]|uniref:antibiotic biosynthesis monooxygenase family protein n=1 Tax=Aquimarina mycalae TaxID=3040073 RepID=UPI002477E6F9|nr:antibiotic biosynthesis monooxygenase [Aquimarina sp. 2201CG14-23]MDH7444949.1 antibiotic biosynthesis monooxygenase [Aquimarina sp. 2201CG14-23]
MIVRIWEGKTKIEHSDVYEKIIEERDIPDYKKTLGFVKLTFLKRADNEFNYFKLLTFWEGLDAIKNFTGPNFEKAVSYKEDEKYLVDFPGKVMHFEVFSE